jgi:hypothetical protein
VPEGWAEAGVGDEQPPRLHCHGCDRADQLLVAQGLPRLRAGCHRRQQRHQGRGPRPLRIPGCPSRCKRRYFCHVNDSTSLHTPFMHENDEPFACCFSCSTMQILYSVPFAVTAQLAASKGGGQGLCTGVLNISIVIPQVSSIIAAIVPVDTFCP